jgi:hypothetical protein
MRVVLVAATNRSLRPEMAAELRAIYAASIPRMDLFEPHALVLTEDKYRALMELLDLEKGENATT